ncbi:hypothetical protein JNO04_01275 [Halomonas sp. MC140]|nr:hypothetical protein [Halomonas sp. MC140]MDN7130982.1 hypothetical protein [Halomonas sp. MC140]
MVIAETVKIVLLIMFFSCSHWRYYFLYMINFYHIWLNCSGQAMTMEDKIARLGGEIVFLTAAAQGIGRASVEAFALAGAAIDINGEKLSKLS